MASLDLMAFIYMVHCELDRKDAAWALDRDDRFSDGVRVGMRIAQTVMKSIYESEFDKGNEADRL